MDVHGPHSSPHCSYRPIIGFGPLPLHENYCTKTAISSQQMLRLMSIHHCGEANHQQSPISPEVIEGSLEVKLPTIWTNEKQRWEESEKRREEKKKEDQKENVSEERRSRCAKR